jgi:hypothetical protein
MSSIHFQQTTTLTPEQFVAGLTDFGPGRAELFPNSADGYLQVHYQGRYEADVTEGSRGIWERLHYDWSDLNHVKLTVIDSNLWGGASSHNYTFRQEPDGTTVINVLIVREGKNLRGRALAGLLGIVGTRVFGKAFAASVKAIEARQAQLHRP